MHLHEPDKELDEHSKRVANVSSLSLAEMLQGHGVTSKNKVLLAYVLARSVWQFYSSDWMKTPWSTDCIHFMWERPVSDKTRQTIDPGYPYLAFALDSEAAGDGAVEYCTEHSVYHRYPLVLALGVILIEICHHTSPTQLAHDETLEAKINTDFFYGQDIIESESWPDLDLNIKAKKIYKNVVKACLNHELFTQTAVEDVKSRREILWKVAVYPLARLAANMGWLWLENGSIRRVDAESIPGRTTATKEKASGLQISSKSGSARKTPRSGGPEFADGVKTG